MPGGEVMLPCLLLLTLPLVWASGFQGIPGNYCRFRKPSECCLDRLDDCAVKIRDTLCYCDEFCLNKDDTSGLHDDCCPDFREVCLGILPQPPPEIDIQSDDPGTLTYKGCVRDGVVVPDLATHKFNCHQCKCEGGHLECEKDACLVEETTIKNVNQRAGSYTWQATNYTKFWGWKAREGVKFRTGALAPSFVMHPISLSPVASLIPREFNAQEKRDWRGLISGVRDQGWCGASWAFSSVAVAQDRLAIMMRDGSRQLSPEQLVECAHQTQDSCRVGGHLNRAWNYLRTIGVVREECLPYQSGKLGEAQECRVPRGSTTMLRCQSPDLYKMEPAYRISSNEDDIQWEIMKNGPVQALMQVSPELFVYASGVYQCDKMGNNNDFASLHAVRLVGWGEEVLQSGASPTKYWVVANSWGEDWGEGGYFRISRGSDECGIESYVHAVRPRLANLVYGN